MAQSTPVEKRTGAESGSGFSQMKQPSLAELAAVQLREAIVSGRLAPGTRISDLHIAEEMGISRAPVREAIRRLEARGLVDDVPRRGSFVARLTRESVTQVYDCRRALEGLAARRLAVSERMPEATAQLQAIVGEMDAAGKRGDPLETAEVDHRFHVTLCDLTGNDWLVRLYAQLADQSRMMQALDSVAHATSGDRRDLVMRHQPIVDAIAGGDADVAEREIIAHIDLSERLFIDEVPELRQED